MKNKETKHTPGPWESGATTKRNYFGTFFNKIYATDANGKEIILATVTHTNKETAHANSKLIATVLDLLEALQLCQPYMHDLAEENGNEPTVGIFKDHDLDRAYQKLIDAIKKATE